MAAKIKSVLYHAPFAQPKAFLVLKEHKDGTVDIGLADGTVVVRGCQVKDQPEHGHATADANAEETAAELSSAAQVQAKLEAMTRDQLAAKVADYNATAAADKKIVIAPTVGKPELVEKLLAVLVTTE